MTRAVLRQVRRAPEHFFAPVSTASCHDQARHHARQAVQACAGRAISAAKAFPAEAAFFRSPRAAGNPV